MSNLDVQDVEEHLNSHFIVKRLSCYFVRIVSHSELMVQRTRWLGGLCVCVGGLIAEGYERHHFVASFISSKGDEGKTSDDISLTLVENCSHYHGKGAIFHIRIRPK